jgi:hypothetical protein
MGIVSNQGTDNIIFRDMILIDNHYSAVAMVGLEGDKQSAKMRNVIFYGETEARDCDKQNECEGNEWANGCETKNAIMPSNYADHNKPPLISAPPMFP